LDARAAIDIAPEVASIMAKETGKDIEWEKVQVEEFIELAQHYLLVPYNPDK
jgi:glycerol-3-phosphate dehydrogenase